MGGSDLRHRRRAVNFALATALSTVCRLLDVDVVVDHNVAAQPYWGATGHYSIAGLAVDHINNTKLGKLLDANADRLTFDKSALAPGKIEDRLKNTEEFVPLADVPDVIWKKLPVERNGIKAVRGGRDTSRNHGPEHPNHYCDIDEPDGTGQTLRELCVADPANVDVKVWKDFYTAAGHTDPASRGCLPFRVWQFYDAMVDAVTNNDLAAYVAAAGLVAHYVGDACQPLHGSYLSDGRRADGDDTNWAGHGVHSAFETDMVNDHAADLFSKIDADLHATPAAAPTISAAATPPWRSCC